MIGAAQIQTHPVGLFPVPEYIVGTDILRTWQISHVGSLVCGGRAIAFAKAK